MNRLATVIGPLIVACTAIVVAKANAEVTLPRVFGDNMVLQRGMPVPVWGTAQAGETITVTLGRQTRTATADDAGRWLLRFGPLEVGRPLEMTVAGKNRITIRNVLAGEVWLCSGQSNMVWHLDKAQGGEHAAAAANDPNIRLYGRGRERGWAECSPKTAATFSAVGYFFGRELREHLKVPVGLIACCTGGVPVESYMSRESLKADPEFRSVFERKAKTAAKRPVYLFDNQIALLIPYAIRGVIWYQGESNANSGSPILYRKLFPAMIRDWRTRWDEGDFAFLFVQLANRGGRRTPEPTNHPWAELREAQLMSLSVPKTGMAVTIDIGEANIHPKNKLDVGRRLALAARGVAYGEKLVYSGPLYKAMKREGNRIRITFDHVGGGLVAHGGSLEHFAIAGADRNFVWAKAAIEGDNVVVWSDKVFNPVAVRYAWAFNPQGCNLYNKEGLPASPFRTDDWPTPAGH